jgi:hypothetical protein
MNTGGLFKEYFPSLPVVSLYPNVARPTITPLNGESLAESVTIPVRLTV